MRRRPHRVVKSVGQLVDDGHDRPGFASSKGKDARRINPKTMVDGMANCEGSSFLLSRAQDDPGKLTVTVFDVVPENSSSIGARKLPPDLTKEIQKLVAVAWLPVQMDKANFFARGQLDDWFM